MSAVARMQTLVATGLGVGYAPLAPGTFGAALGLLLFWLMRNLPPWAHLIGVALVFVGGAVAATAVERRLGRHDPGLVVIDEVAGMWASLVLLPFTTLTAVLAFVAFRITDTLKPWPARQLEDLPEGWGIMSDDLMAGIYANLLVRVALLAWP